MMKKLLLVLFILPLVIKSPVAASKQEGFPDAQSHQVQIQPSQLDKRARILAAYFAKYNSPLENHSQDFIDAADQFNLDWKFLPAIAGVESTFGKFIPGGYNAWGWGVYGNQSMGFKSWREGIFTVAAGLKEGYFNKGLTDPYTINRVYAASPTWGRNVTYFLKDLEKFEREYTDSVQTSLNISDSTAGPSGTLASR